MKSVATFKRPSVQMPGPTCIHLDRDDCQKIKSVRVASALTTKGHPYVPRPHRLASGIAECSQVSTERWLRTIGNVGVWRSPSLVAKPLPRPLQLRRGLTDCQAVEITLDTLPVPQAVSRQHNGRLLPGHLANAQKLARISWHAQKRSNPSSILQGINP